MVENGFANLETLVLSMNFSPARGILSPQIRTDSHLESHYLTELLVERQNLEPLIQLFPNCGRLLDYEIFCVSGRLTGHGFTGIGTPHFGAPSPLIFPNMMAGSSNWSGNGWNNLQPEGLGVLPGTIVDWQSAARSSTSSAEKKILRIDVPVALYPSFNFVGRLLGPRGNSLKRIEAATGCRLIIRGKGSIRDREKEERLRGKPGHEHLNEPLHIIIEASSPPNIVDAQLRHARDIIQEILKPVKN
ncbi:KH domain-containing protein SPIN1-like isoform X2 [Andrographis paniculata]|uniref:KH domain-containing protein SPIN1-like isoform X2 n=1 Tax=Andrographis paniculata TaxID=175694 RepID=UPI0021E887E2|nr:KH domain-containing protein SPIN1-like isoform X2 [Andrographis paniculata]